MRKYQTYLRSVLSTLVVFFLFIFIGIAAGEKWHVVSELPTLRSGFSTAVVDGKIYLIGGTPFQNRRGPYGLSTVEVYDPKTNRWEQVADMPTLRTSTETAVINGTIYVCGGYNGIDNRADNLWQNRVPQYMATVDTYNPETEEWSDIPPMPTPFMPFDAAVVDGNIYVFGGIGENRKHFTSVMVFGEGFPTVEANDKLPVEANGKLPTRWGALKREREDQP